MDAQRLTGRPAAAPDTLRLAVAVPPAAERAPHAHAPDAVAVDRAVLARALQRDLVAQRAGRPVVLTRDTTPGPHALRLVLATYTHHYGAPRHRAAVQVWAEATAPGGGPVSEYLYADVVHWTAAGPAEAQATLDAARERLATHLAAFLDSVRSGRLATQTAPPAGGGWAVAQSDRDAWCPAAPVTGFAPVNGEFVTRTAARPTAVAARVVALLGICGLASAIDPPVVNDAGVLTIGLGVDRTTDGPRELTVQAVVASEHGVGPSGTRPVTRVTLSAREAAPGAAAASAQPVTAASRGRAGEVWQALRGAAAQLAAEAPPVR